MTAPRAGRNGVTGGCAACGGQHNGGTRTESWSHRKVRIPVKRKCVRLTPHSKVRARISCVISDSWPTCKRAGTTWWTRSSKVGRSKEDSTSRMSEGGSSRWTATRRWTIGELERNSEAITSETSHLLPHTCTLVHATRAQTGMSFGAVRTPHQRGLLPPASVVAVSDSSQMFPSLFDSTLVQHVPTRPKPSSRVGARKGHLQVRPESSGNWDPPAGSPCAGEGHREGLGKKPSQC